MTNPIGWCDETINPFPGCSWISPACDHCYAESMARRLVGAGVYQPYLIENGHWSGRVMYRPEALDKLTTWKRRRRVFVESMGDVYHPAIPHEWRLDLFLRMLLNRRHTYLVLTKRTREAAGWWDYVKKALPDFYDECVVNLDLWHGATAEDQPRLEERWRDLLRLPGRHFLSCEPLLGPIDPAKAAEPFQWFRTVWWDTDTPGGKPPQSRGIEWVIVGGENGPQARAMDPFWALALRDRCWAQKVPFYFKGFGDRVGIADHLELLGCKEIPGQ